MKLQELLDRYNIKARCSSDLPDGWHRLVETLIVDLIKIGWDGELEQVKEKFGGLRFYIGATTPEITELIKEAESASYTTCTDCGCGSAKRTSNRGWVRTLCEACAAQLPKRD